MTLRQQEYIRLAAFIAAFGSSYLTRSNNANINELLSTFNLTMEEISKICYIVEYITLIGASRIERITQEHKHIKMTYNEVIKNAADLFKVVEVDKNPVKSFALYVYLYRKGYFSYAHQFMYSFSCKDLSLLTGADIVSGKGVCRSISSMFTDICNQNGMEATNIPVKVNPKKFNDKITLCPIELKYENGNTLGESFGNILSFLAPYLPLGNHVTSHILYNGLKYDFDPTNDILLTEQYGKLFVSDSKKSYVTHDRIFGFVPYLLGQIDFNVKGIIGLRDIKLQTITHDEYIKAYRETLEMIKDNLDLFEKFYYDNKDKYYEIASTANNQHSMIKRYLPILPIK